MPGTALPSWHAQTSTSPRWTHVLRAADGPLRARLVVFAHSASGPNALLPLVRRLDSSIEVVGVTLPGRERRFGESTEGLLADPMGVPACVATELDLLPSAPTALFGHSLGSSLASATAMRMAVAPSAIVLSATPLTGKPEGEGPIETEADLDDVVRRGGGTPAEVMAEPALREHVLGLLKVDLRLGELVALANLGRVLPVEPVVLGGRDDELVPAAEMHRVAAVHRADGRARLLPGGHFYLLEDRNLDEVVAVLEQAVLGGAAR